MSVIIADVWFTASDATYYVGKCPGRYQETYDGVSVADVVARVEADGWESLGTIGRFDCEAVRMWGHGWSLVYYAELTAIWDDELQPPRPRSS